MTPSPTNEQRIEQVIILTERLTALIVEQAKSFEGGRPQDATDNMAETAKLANAYRQEAQSIRGEPSALTDIAPAQRERLVRATEAFDAVIARQARALAAAKSVTEGLVRTIAEEIASKRGAGAGYGPRGAKPVAGAATSLTLNQRA